LNLIYKRGRFDKDFIYDWKPNLKHLRKDYPDLDVALKWTAPQTTAGIPLLLPFLAPQIRLLLTIVRVYK